MAHFFKHQFEQALVTLLTALAELPSHPDVHRYSRPAAREWGSWRKRIGLSSAYERSLMTGDGRLVEFSSVVDALRTAREDFGKVAIGHG